MSIDTGANSTVTSTVYDAYFPRPNENQSSQQFRDNFAIIEFAIENLQKAKTNANSGVFSVNTTVQSTGEILLTTAFKDNAFILPVGSPSATPVAGMIRYNVPAGAPEVYNGTAWRGAVQTNTDGSVTLDTLTVNTKLTLNFTPVSNTDAVPLGYFNSRLSNAVTAINANTSALANAIAAEANTRAAADTVLTNTTINLQNQIGAINANVANTNTNTVALAGLIQNNADAIAAEANARIAADAAFANAVADYAANIATLNDQVTILADEANDEQGWRIANDALLAGRIDSLYANSLTDATNLAQEIVNRTAADLALSNAISLVNNAIVLETSTRQTADNNLSQRIDELDFTTSHNYRQDTDPVLDQANSVVWDNATAYNIGDLVYKDGRVFRAEQPNTNSDPWMIGTTDWQDVTVVNNGDLWIIAPGGNIIKVYIAEYDTNDPPNLLSAEWEDVVAGDLSNYLNRTTGGTVSGPTTFANTTLTVSNTTVLLPNTDLTIDAGRYLFMNKIPNTTGAGDGGFMTVDQNNFNYAVMSPAVANNVANSIVANGIANTNALYEFSVLRIGTTNDPANGTNNDSMALEPAADLFLNPGWAGDIAVNANTHVVTDNRTVNLANSAIFVGNATNWVLKIERATGNMHSKGDFDTTGNITAAGDISGLSDESLKDNVNTLIGALEMVRALRGVSFTRNDLPGNPEQIGFLAQEVRPVIPQVVHALPNGMLALAYANLTAVLVEAVKELANEQDAMRADIAAIKGNLGL